jgi:hypothetical protein
MRDEGRHDLRLSHISPYLNLFGGVEGRRWKLTTKMITFNDIENMHVIRLEGANRVGGGAEGGNAPDRCRTLGL